MTVSPTPPAPIKPTAGGSFATLLPDYNALAADASGQYGYGTKKIINGIATDKASQLAKFRQNIRTSANQSEYQNNVEILKRLGLVSGKSPSRTSVDTGYDALLTDFYLSPDKDFSTYISTRLTTAQTKGIGTSTTTSRQQSTSAEAAQIITDAFKGYLNIIPNASTITSFTKDLINLEKKL